MPQDVIKYFDPDAVDIGLSRVMISLTGLFNQPGIKNKKLLTFE